MGKLTISKNKGMDATIISNTFIDEYMEDANDAQIKIYLYLSRMLGAGLSTSVSEISDKFNYTEKDVMRSLKYWEKAHVMTLEYDESKNLTGIRLENLLSQTRNSTPSVLNETSMETESPKPAPVVSIVTRQVESRETVPEVPEEDPFAKPSYSADDLRSFKDRENTRQLFFIAESYIGKPLTPGDMKSILYFSDCLHFSDDLIDYLIQYCVDRGKKDFKYIEAVAINWAKSGVTTPKQAEKFATKYDKSVYTIMKDLGRNGSPTGKELEYINRWLKEYAFSQDIIAEACERTVLATNSHRFEYAEGILSNWKKENVKKKSDIQKVDDLYQKRRQAKSPVSGPNRFNQFVQRDYNFDELEAKLLSK